MAVSMEKESRGALSYPAISLWEGEGLMSGSLSGLAWAKAETTLPDGWLLVIENSVADSFYSVQIISHREVAL